MSPSMPAKAAPTSTPLVIVNPASGNGRTAARWRQLAARFRDMGGRATWQCTERSGHATSLARDYVGSGGREIIVLGGDGTVNEVVTGLFDEAGNARNDGITLAVIHQGTGGDFARTLMIPRSAPAALKLAADARAVRAVDVGIATFADGTTRPFLTCANIGMSAAVVRRVDGGGLRKLGNTPAFAVAALMSMARDARNAMRIEIDGTKHDLELVDAVFANGRYMGAGMKIAPDAQPDDGLLDAILVSSAHPLRLATKLAKLYRGTHVNDRLVRTQQCHTAWIDGRDGHLPVVLDGEIAGATPVSLRVAPRALRVHVPAPR